MTVAACGCHTSAALGRAGKNLDFVSGGWNLPVEHPAQGTRPSTVEGNPAPSALSLSSASPRAPPRFS